MKNLKLDRLPPKPGVYLLKGRGDQVLYVGKAANLRLRVKSHFRPTAAILELKRPRLTFETAKVNFIEVESEVEALLLEANLIKKYQPKYNTRLKDDKSYLYIKITTDEDFPKVLTSRREKLPDAACFGPFPSAKTVRSTLKSLRRIFPYCNCNFKACQRRKSCFYIEIGLDAGPCLGLISKNEYRKIIRRLILLFEGKKEVLFSDLKKEMGKAAKAEEFEKAQALKKQIEGLDYLTRPRLSPAVYLEEPEYLARRRESGLRMLKKIVGLPKIPQRIEGFDISDIHGKESTGSMVVFQSGESDKSQYRRFKVKSEDGPNDVAMMQEIIRRRLKHTEWLLADLIIVDGGKGQVSEVVGVLREKGLTIPVIGLAKRLEEIIIPKLKNLRTKGLKDLKGRGMEFETMRLSGDSPTLHLLQAIRDEAHRFALTYHRKLRIKNFNLLTRR